MKPTISKEGAKAPHKMAPRRIGINGFGRMGRLTARILLLHANELDMELVQVNDKLGNAEMAAYLLEFDSIHGRFPLPVGFNGQDVIVVDHTRTISFSKHDKPEHIAWKEVDLVFECTGQILTLNELNKHRNSSSSREMKIVVSAPVDDKAVLNVVMGCNDKLIQANMRICTAASCTTNCAAPVVGAIDQALGIELGSINTIHNVTPTQTLMDTINPGKKQDLRRARSGASNLAPTTTGSAKAIGMIFPHLQGKLNGLAVRVPLQNASLTDMVLMVKRDTTVREVNDILRKASESIPHVLGYETRALVSSDYANDSRSSIVDALSTQVVGGKMVKILAWYDNEWGYVNRMVNIARTMLFPVPGSKL